MIPMRIFIASVLCLTLVGAVPLTGAHDSNLASREYGGEAIFHKRMLGGVFKLKSKEQKTAEKASKKAAEAADAAADREWEAQRAREHKARMNENKKMYRETAAELREKHAAQEMEKSGQGNPQKAPKVSVPVLPKDYTKDERREHDRKRMNDANAELEAEKRKSLRHSQGR